MPYDTGVSSSVDSVAQREAQAQAGAERLKQQAQQTYFGAPNPQVPGQWGYTTGAPSSTPAQNPPTKVNPLQPSGYLRPIPASPANAIAPNPYLAPYARTPAQLPAPLPGGKRLFTPPLESAQFTTLSTPRIAPPVTPEVSGGSYLQSRAKVPVEAPEAPFPAGPPSPGGATITPRTLSPREAADAYRAAQDPTLPQVVRDNALAEYRTATRDVRERINPPVQNETMAEWKNRMDTRTDYDRFLLERGVSPGKIGAARVAAEDAAIGAAERKVDAGQELTPGEMATLKSHQVRREKYERVPAIGPGSVTERAMREANEVSAHYGQLNKELEILRQQRDTAGMKAKRAEIQAFKDETGASRGFEGVLKNRLERLEGERQEFARIQRGGKPKEVAVTPRAEVPKPEERAAEKTEEEEDKKKKKGVVRTGEHGNRRVYTG